MTREEFFNSIPKDAPHTEENYQAALRMRTRPEFEINENDSWLEAKEKMIATLDMMSAMAFEEYDDPEN